MLEGLFRRRPTLVAVRQCWMRDSIENYLADLAEARHARCSLQNKAYLLLRFAAFTTKHGCRTIGEITEWAAPFAEQHEHRKYRAAILQELHRFIRHLQRQGIVPTPAPPQTPFSGVVDGYDEFMRNRCNLSEATIATRRGFCHRFLQHVYESGTRDLKAMTLGTVQDFVISEGNSHTRGTMITNCSALRQFLFYLYSRGQIERDISSLLISPRSYQHERCPKFLTDAQIAAVLSSIDRHSSMGMRNYAMILLLATYGLRSKEVAQLRLEDIDWRADKFHIRKRKSGNTTVYPLAPSVGQAILCYLKNGRPESTHRQIFLIHVAPFTPATPAAVRHATHKYLVLSGIKKRGINTHSFRYSCAQQLFESDFSIKDIADYLGHGKLTSTQRYMKIDIKHLREVALNSGEDML